MAIALTLRQYLDSRAVNYDVLVHRQTTNSTRTAEVSHIPRESLAKAVLLRGASGYLVAVVPATCQVEMDQVAALLERTVCLADEDEIQSLFPDCERGALPPLVAAYGVDAVIDERLENQDDIYLEAGDHRSLIHLSLQQFNGLTWSAYRGHISEPR